MQGFMCRWLFPVLLLNCAAVTAGETSKIRYAHDQIPWVAAPPSLPAGAQVAVLEGDPKSTGWFTMRVRLPAGAQLLPHWHPNVERVTVISGSIGLGLGERFDPAQLQLFKAGSYYVTPPGVAHFASTFEDAVLQVTTQGPWELKKLGVAK